MGCQCSLEYVWDGEDFQIHISLDEKNMLDEVEEDDPVERMKKLKTLLDIGLITKQEYEEKKREILDEI